MYRHYLVYKDNLWIVFRSIFVYYSHCIQIRTLYSHFIWIIQIICTWYLDYLQHYLQTAKTLASDVMVAPCMDLVLFTGGGAVPAFFSSAFLLSQSSFSLCLCSSTASLVLSLFFLSSSFAPLAFWSSCAVKRNLVKASHAHYYNGSK